MDNEPRNMFDNANKMNMTIPERIVLSAGYDGDDNDEATLRQYRNTFDEPPIVNPDDVMAGMHTPPSVLTIDNSTSYKRDSQNWHQEGDGADANDSESSLFRALHDNDDNEEEYSSVLSPQRSVVIAGQEDYYNNIHFDDPHTVQRYYASMQRRIAILENELEYQNRISNVWKYLLLTLTVINPFIINYLFNTLGRRR